MKEIIVDGNSYWAFEVNRLSDYFVLEEAKLFKRFVISISESQIVYSKNSSWNYL